MSQRKRRNTSVAGTPYGTFTSPDHVEANDGRAGTHSIPESPPFVWITDLPPTPEPEHHHSTFDPWYPQSSSRQCPVPPSSSYHSTDFSQQVYASPPPNAPLGFTPLKPTDYGDTDLINPRPSTDPKRIEANGGHVGTNSIPNSTPRGWVPNLPPLPKYPPSTSDRGLSRTIADYPRSSVRQLARLPPIKSPINDPYKNGSPSYDFNQQFDEAPQTLPQTRPGSTEFNRETSEDFRPYTDPPRLQSTQSRRTAAGGGRAYMYSVPNPPLGGFSPEPHYLNPGIRMHIPSTSTSVPQEHVLGSYEWLTHTNTGNPGSHEKHHANTDPPPSETILNAHDYAELQNLEEQQEISPSNILRDLLLKYSHLDISGKVREISTVQSNLGGYSDIFTGYYLRSRYDTRVKVAVKRLRVRIMDDAKFQKNLAKELYIWSKLDHPNILRLEGFFLGDEQFPQLVSKWMENGTVLEFLKTRPSLGVLDIISGIGRGIEYLHSNQIVHSDIKPDNVMISGSGRPLLCDFGVSRMLSTSMSMQFSSTASGRLRGTLRFMSKEIIMPTDSAPTPYTTESDVWAFGMTVYTILTKRLPYCDHKLDAHVILAIVQGSLPLRPDDFNSWTNENQIIWRIIEFCWLPPSDRPSMSACTSELEFLGHTLYAEELYFREIGDAASYSFSHIGSKGSLDNNR